MHQRIANGRLVSAEVGGETKRTELGDKIASEKTRAAEYCRNVPCDRTAPSRTMRDDRWPVGQGKQVVHSALKPQKISIWSSSERGK